MTRDWERVTQVLGISHILTYVCMQALETTNLFLYRYRNQTSMISQILQTFATELAAMFFSKISPTVPFVPTHGPTLNLTYQGDEICDCYFRNVPSAST